jgi:hypothetical protein
MRWRQRFKHAIHFPAIQQPEEFFSPVSPRAAAPSRAAGIEGAKKPISIVFL